MMQYYLALLNQAGGRDNIVLYRAFREVVEVDHYHYRLCVRLLEGVANVWISFADVDTLSMYLWMQQVGVMFEAWATLG